MRSSPREPEAKSQLWKQPPAPRSFWARSSRVACQGPHGRRHDPGAALSARLQLEGLDPQLSQMHFRVAESSALTVGADLNWGSPPGASQVQGLRVRDGERP